MRRMFIFNIDVEVSFAIIFKMSKLNTTFENQIK